MSNAPRQARPTRALDPDTSTDQQATPTHTQRSIELDRSPRQTVQHQRIAALREGEDSRLRHQAHVFATNDSPRQVMQQQRIDALQQREASSSPSSGLPQALRQGVETLSGISMAGVSVHYNSSAPMQMHAHAYAQGRNIYLGPGQERHLPHEAWHVVQQAQGRVRPTVQMAGAHVNDDPALEREADVMGAKASGFVAGVAQATSLTSNDPVASPPSSTGVQLRSYYHGRSESRAEASAAPTPIHDMYSRTSLDFDPTGKGGFYMAHTVGIASNWAKTKAARYRDDAKSSGKITPQTRPIPMLYTYEVEDEALAPLSGMGWETRLNAKDEIEFASEEERQSWQKFVLRSRQNRNDHSADYVQGPLISNPEAAAAAVRVLEHDKGSKLDVEELDKVATDKVEAHKVGDQTAIYTAKAKDVFQAGFVGREALPFVDPEYLQVEKASDLVKGDRADVARRRLGQPELENTIVLKQYRQSLRRSIVTRFTADFDPVDADKIGTLLMEYEALGDLENIRLGLERLEREKRRPENREYVSDDAKFADFTLAEWDYQVLVRLLRLRVGDVVSQLGWKDPDMKYLELAGGDFVTAYHIRRACEKVKIPYLAKFEKAPLGPLLGTGKKKVAYEVAGDRNTVLVKMKEFDFFRLIGGEIEMLSMLATAGVPVIHVIGITMHAGMPAIIMPRMAEQSKDFKAELDETPHLAVPEGKLRRGDKLINKARFFKPETLQTLVHIQEGLTKAQLRVSDLQFLISAEGTIVVADPRKIQIGLPPTQGNIGTINHTLAAGVLALLELDRLPMESVSYKATFASIVKLTGLSPETDQVDDILNILASKYDVPLQHDDPGVGKRKPVSSGPVLSGPVASSADSDTKPASGIEDWKRIVLAKLAESAVIKVPGKPSKVTEALRFVAVSNSKSDEVTQSVFGLTAHQFFEAFKVLNNKTGPKITYDSTGIYLLQ
ncbi:DUF4157 domain-containing protein [Luteibacter sp. CQ10]|uniref:eCIS core domain-containing protein n=1 Tax=Luteibacter sp. CQ10 TaxID=2805821 RepID=UPI0034A23D90